MHRISKPIFAMAIQLLWINQRGYHFPHRFSLGTAFTKAHVFLDIRQFY